MKKINRILLTVTALFAVAPAVFSQPGEWSINGQINETVGGTVKYLEWPHAAENGLQTPPGTDFAYSKDISAPQSDGTYWIKLESFATGAASRILSSTPSDIILVLDSSTSMNTEDYGGEYSARTSQGYTYNNAYVTSGTGWQQTSNPAYYYKHTDGKYYLVYRRQSGNTRYLYITIGETTYYLSGSSITTTPTGVSGGNNVNNTTIWTGVLYEKINQVSRIRALRDATEQFIQNIYDNDAEVTAVDASFPGNRIAIVSYDNSAHLLTSGWVDVGESGAVGTLTYAVEHMDLANWTRPDLGMSSAISTFLSGSDADHTKREGANLTVVMFTDGVPCHNDGSGNTFQAEDANKAIYQGYLLKHNHNATLYTVGLLDLTKDDDNIKCGKYFLDLLSSNYPDSYIAQSNASSSTWTVNGDNITVQNLTTGTKDPEGEYFMLVDENMDLTAIFDKISKQSGGSASELSASSRNVDVVSNSFIIPGATAENIGTKVKVFVAKFEGYTISGNQKEYSFSEEILIKHTPDEPLDDITGYYYYPLDEDGNIPDDAELTKVDAEISVSYNAATQAVTVTGFDYGSNFCGPIYKTNWDPKQHSEQDNISPTGGLDHWQGFKIIIMIPIEMNPDAVGGPDVPTNAPGSGIFIDNEDTQGLVQFKSPKVSLPVNIYLTKSGLGAGESAKFRIDRAQLPDPVPANFDPATYYTDESAWSYVSTVFVTKPQGSTATDPDPIVKVKGLPANMDVEVAGEGGSTTTIHKSFVYRITEENWSWSYTAQTPPQYTTTSNVTNPFTFNNDKKDNIDFEIRHAESKATNVFKPNVVTNNVKYDDSKPRKPKSSDNGGGSGSGGTQ